MKSIILLVFIFVFTTKLKASSKVQNIVCTHQMVCDQVSKIIELNKYKIIEAFEKNSDPHHSSLSPLQIKKIKNADLIIRGPQKLSPSLNSIFLQSKKLTIELENHQTKINPHFWLFKEVNCQIEKQLKTKLHKLKIKMKTAASCLNYELQSSLEIEIKNILAIKKVTLILPHNSFTEYLKGLGFDAYSLYKPGHHKHINLKILKKVERLKSMNSDSWYWLLDDTLEDKKYITKTDKIINIKLMGPLENILKILKMELSK